MNISKELLSEVLNINVQTEIHEDDWCSDNTLIYWEFDGYHNDYKNINIYELTHKCKEWALNKDYKLLSMSKECFLYDIVELYDVSEQLEQWIEWFEADTETEAVFNACQWILDNKDNK